MEVTKPYKFIGFGAMEVTKPYRFIGFGAQDATCQFLVVEAGDGEIALHNPFNNRFVRLHGVSGIERPIKTV